jgi:hypothetical protein
VCELCVWLAYRSAGDAEPGAAPDPAPASDFR